MAHQSSLFVRHFSHAGIAYGEAYPEDLNFGLYLNRVGTISYTLDESHPLGNEQYTYPYGSDYILYAKHDGVEYPIQGGLHTAVDIGELEGNEIQVAGNDWLHYLEKSEYPFNPSSPLQYYYTVTNRDIALIVKDMLDTVLAQSHTLNLTYALAAIGQTTNYKIDPADTQKILSKIEELSRLDPGFDYEITPDKVFRIYAGKKGAHNNLGLEAGVNIYKCSYRNAGVFATHTRGFGSTGSTRLGRIVDSGAMAYYRRLTESEEFPIVRDATDLQNKVNAEAVRHAEPVVTFTCVILTDAAHNVWDGNTLVLGDTYDIKADLGYTVVDDEMRLVGIEGQSDDNGEVELTLTFDDGTLSL